MEMIRELTHKAYLERDMAKRTRHKPSQEQHYRKAQEYLDAAAVAKKTLKEAK